MITDIDQTRVIQLLLRDIAATVGAGHECVVQRYAEHERDFCEDLGRYTERVVEDVQQYFHDCFVDTTWPRCPHHANHPLWFREGAWCADDQPVAALGELHAVFKSPAS